MGVPILSLCSWDQPLALLLWVIAVSTIKGEVTTPASLTAVAGLPFTLSCNVTVETEDRVRQVRWLGIDEQVLLAYEPGRPARITFQRVGVALSPSPSPDLSTIVIQKAGLSDEGCYRCVFDVYPSGSQEGQTCLRVAVKVRSPGNQTAVRGGRASLSCWYGLPEQVKQVLWRRSQGPHGDSASLASYTPRGNTLIEGPFKDRVTLSPSLEDSQLTIQPIRVEDEGCYTCEFHAFPQGRARHTACLSVYVLPSPTMTSATLPSGVKEVNCSAASRPPSWMSWSVEGYNGTMAEPVSHAHHQGDGTTLMTSTVLLQSEEPREPSVKCSVHHRGLEQPITVSLDGDGPGLVVIVTSCVAALLLCCFCVCLSKYFLCQD